MKTHFVICLLLFALFTLPAQAQDQYRLREPSAEEFLALVPQVVSPCDWEVIQSDSSGVWNLCPYLLNTIETEYPGDLENLPYSLLRPAYDTLKPDTFDVGNTVGNPSLWRRALVLSWLRDNAVDLGSQTELKFDDITVHIETRDFNADSVDEYVLDTTSFNIDALLVMARQADGTYQSVDGNLLPYHDNNVTYGNFHSSYLQDIAFADFNADGLPEWLLIFEGASYRGDYDGEILFLGWRDGRLQSVTQGLITYIPFMTTNTDDLADTSMRNGLVFANLDDDPALELQRIAITTDNWNCEQEDVTVYDWDAAADAYVRLSGTLRQANTANCVIGDAELALFDRRYTTAVHLYEYAYLLAEQNKGIFVFDELRPFIQIRLAQAYLLAREYEAADQVLDALNELDMPSEMLRQMRDILTAHRQSPPDETCITLYDFFAVTASESYDYRAFQEKIGTQLTIGVPGQYRGDHMGAGNPLDPALASCNAPGTLDSYLERVTDRRLDTLLDRLRERGFPGTNSLAADFNGDGKEDWLIWFGVNFDAAFLLNQDEYKPFVLSHPHIYPPDEFTTVETMSLPEQAGTALVLFQALEGLPSSGSLYCGDSGNPLGYVDLWQFSEGRLEHIHSTWCDDRPTLDTLFTEENGTYLFHGRGYDGDARSYIWDSAVRRYVESMPDVPAHTEILPASPEATNAELFEYLGDGIVDYYLRLEDQIRYAESTDAAVAILDAEINAPYMTNPSHLQYWKALILQAANCPDEALAEYVAIYEAAPESAWGMLAALHFEKVNP